MNNLPKVATQWNSGATRESNPGPRARIPSALTTKPLSHIIGATIGWDLTERYDLLNGALLLRVSVQARNLVQHGSCSLF